jgi:hypothetical protein
MSRNGFLPWLTVLSTPSASFSILAVVLLEIASFVRRGKAPPHSSLTVRFADASGRMGA